MYLDVGLSVLLPHHEEELLIVQSAGPGQQSVDPPPASSYSYPLSILLMRSWTSTSVGLWPALLMACCKSCGTEERVKWVGPTEYLDWDDAIVVPVIEVEGLLVGPQFPLPAPGRLVVQVHLSCVQQRPSWGNVRSDGATHTFIPELEEANTQHNIFNNTTPLGARAKVQNNSDSNSLAA